MKNTTKAAISMALLALFIPGPLAVTYLLGFLPLKVDFHTFILMFLGLMAIWLIVTAALVSYYDE